MPKYLRISSKGEVEPGAFSLLGASAKKQENSIGFFGSGAKYAIANLLREGTKFHIFSGERLIDIKTKHVVFRDTKFDVIVIDGKDTSLTTTMGGNDWLGEFPVFRELYSNAVDEGDESLVVTPSVKGVVGTTSVFIEYTPEYAKFFDNFKDYFATTTEAITESVTKYNYPVRVLPKTSDANIRVFRKGILSYWKDKTNDNPSIFNYDLSNLEINESRVAANMHTVRQHIAEAIFRLTDITVFNTYLKGIEGSNTGLFEHDCLLSDWQTPLLSDEVREYLLTQKFVGVEHIRFMPDEPEQEWRRIPFSILKTLLKAIPELKVLGVSADGAAAFPSTPSEELENRVIDALAILRSTSYAPKLKGIKIDFVTFDSELIYGRAIKGAVQLSVKLADKDTNYVAKVIMEELEHLSTGFEDNSRAFQDHWISLYFNELTRRSMSINPVTNKELNESI